MPKPAGNADQSLSMLLRGIFLASPNEIRWFLYEVRQFFPDAWEGFVAALSGKERENILEAYSQRIFKPKDPGQDALAARAWNTF